MRKLSQQGCLNVGAFASSCGNWGDGRTTLKGACIWQTDLRVTNCLWNYFQKTSRYNEGKARILTSFARALCGMS